jgi:hypothetical protein
MHQEERMKLIWAFATLLFITLASGGVNETSLQLSVQPGQSLTLQLSSGDYRVEAGAGDKVVVITQNRPASRQQKPHFGIDANAREASVRVEAPKDYAAVIQVPKNSNLRIRLEGGRLRVDGINGDKDIESNAGAVTIDVGRPENYARVDASVDVGHIDAAPFQIAQDGIERSFSRQGTGSYRLHAHVGTGEIKLYSGAL